MLREEIIKEMKMRFLGNPLFREEITDMPEHFVSVYHFTHERYLEKIGEEGVLPAFAIFQMPERRAEYEKSLNFQVDSIFDRAAPKGLSRMHCVYAHDDYHFTPHLGNGNIILELKVDPKICIVADAQYFFAARICFEKRSETSGLEEYYWKDILPLDDYYSMGIEDRRVKFRFPEILIPGKVGADHIKVKGIFL